MKKIIFVSLSMAAILAVQSFKSFSAPADVVTNSTSTNLVVNLIKTNAFEGEWSGVEVTQGQEGTATLTVKGNTLEFHGANTDDWLKGAFELHENAKPKEFLGVITDCESPDMVGKKIYAIYRIEEGSITIEGSSPGSTNYPSAFGQSDCRQFVFKHKTK